jgi:putative transposase
MCRLLRVSPSGFYAWLRRAPSARAQADALLLEQLRSFHTRSDGTYGAPRLLEDLREVGVRVGQKRIARLLRGARLQGVSRRRGVRTTRRGREETLAADLVQRDFATTAPNQLWVADITYIPTWAGFLFLAVVLDAYSRRIVGWAMATTLRTGLVLDALNMALAQRKPRSVIHHSDQGSQYTSLAFGHRCDAMGVRPSRGSVGDAYDNAMAESFFATLECELLARRRFRTQAEAGSPSSATSRAGTTRTADTPRSVSGPRSAMSARPQMRLESQVADRPPNRVNSTPSISQSHALIVCRPLAAMNPTPCQPAPSMPARPLQSRRRRRNPE